MGFVFWVVFLVVALLVDDVGDVALEALVLLVGLEWVVVGVAVVCCWYVSAGLV